MKTTMKRLTAIFAAVLLLAMAAVPALAKMTVDELTVSDHDAEKLSAFWHQPARDGMNNGEAIYDDIRNHDWLSPEDYGGFDATTLEYDGGWETVLIAPAGEGGSGSFNFLFNYTQRFFGSEETEDGTVFYQGWDHVFPDMYGDLDLSGTRVYRFGMHTEEGDENNHTHLTSVNLNDCSALRTVYFCGHQYCRSFEALNIPMLMSLEAEDCGFEHVAFSPWSLDGNVEVDTLGFGTVGVSYTNDKIKLFAYPENGKFIGWFIDGECVSSNLTYNCQSEGNIVAYFGGDADGNGIIDTTDALLLLRSSLGVTEELDADIADVNNDGAVDTADALEILRYALGVR